MFLNFGVALCRSGFKSTLVLNVNLSSFLKSGINNWAAATMQSELSIIKIKSSGVRDCRTEGREKCQVPVKRQVQPDLFGLELCCREMIGILLILLFIYFFFFFKAAFVRRW